MSKKGLKKVWRAFLGIATEITMAVFIISVGLGLSWLFTKTVP